MPARALRHQLDSAPPRIIAQNKHSRAKSRRASLDRSRRQRTREHPHHDATRASRSPRLQPAWNRRPELPTGTSALFLPEADDGYRTDIRKLEQPTLDVISNRAVNRNRRERFPSLREARLMILGN